MKTDPNSPITPDPTHNLPGLTKREWFAGMYAAGDNTPSACVDWADKLIAALNAEEPPK